MNEMERALAGENKATYVSRMFGRIARRYDLMNSLMTFGQHQRWRALMARLAQVPTGGLVLDLATGTGDVGLAVLARAPAARVIGIDFAIPMMVVGRHKARRRRAPLDFAGGDALALPFRDNTFDAVLHAFLMRNIVDIEQGFAEQFRVLKPGRRLVWLDATMPPLAPLRRLFAFAFGTLIPLLGRVVTGQGEAYTYLPESIQRFPEPARLCDLMREVGFLDVRYRRMMFGTVAVHVGVKPGAGA